jgi:cytoskeletal protein CcmA (bactofilin family)
LSYKKNLNLKGENMAFFRKNDRVQETKPKKEVEVIQQKKVAKPKPTQSTIISKGIVVEGNISGSDFVQVDGKLNGNITIANVTIGRTGVVNGVIRAENVAIEGELKGEIYCSDLEIKRTGKVSNKIESVHLLISGAVIGEIFSSNIVTISKEGKVKAKNIQSQKVVIHGTVDGKVHSEEIIEVGHDGKITTDRLESKKVLVNGKIDGKITASSLLEVGRNGFVQGEITVKNIKTEEGGRVIGTMVTYEETKPKQLESAPKIPNSNPDIIDTETA